MDSIGLLCKQDMTSKLCPIYYFLSCFTFSNTIFFIIAWSQADSNVEELFYVSHNGYTRWTHHSLGTKAAQRKKVFAKCLLSAPMFTRLILSLQVRSDLQNWLIQWFSPLAPCFVLFFFIFRVVCHFWRKSDLLHCVQNAVQWWRTK